MKSCRDCHQTKDFIDFYKISHTKDGYDSKCRKCHNKKSSAAYFKRKETNPTYTKERKLKSKYNITLNEYNVLLTYQNNVCAICFLPETNKNQYGKPSLSVDHCHTTGKVRGLLCSNCNTAIGLLRDNPLAAFNASKYLASHEK